MKTALRKTDTLIEEPVDLELLTPRQLDILRLVSIGHTNREIANMLQISVRTVEVHRFNLMRRLNVRNVAQLLRRAVQRGLLSKSFGK
jgi:DNA-binding NarL/FixJ family response regulator